MITTKGQQKKIETSNPGYGWIVFKNGDEITEIEIYVGKDNRLRRVKTGKPLLPFSFINEDYNHQEVS